jgi:hypothetical protein
MTPSRRGGLAALAWGAAEASLFFIVPDVLIGWLALRGGLRPGARAALFAAVGAMLGGALIFAWAAANPLAALNAVEAVPGVSTAMVGAAREDIDERGWLLATLSGPLSATPYKVYAALAPEVDASLPVFAAAALPTRLPRFLMVALVFALLGRLLRDRVPPRRLLAIYAIGWVLFYSWFWTANAG